ncbi:hypothetical protein D3C76_1569450 [compost metagenome]
MRTCVLRTVGRTAAAVWPPLQKCTRCGNAAHEFFRTRGDSGDALLARCLRLRGMDRSEIRPAQKVQASHVRNPVVAVDVRDNVLRCPGHDHCDHGHTLCEGLLVLPKAPYFRLRMADVLGER